MEREYGAVTDLQQLANQQAIREIIFSHSRGLDRLDVECLKAAYWPEAEVDYGSFKGKAHDFAVLVVGALKEAYALTSHSLGNTLIDCTATTAKAESYVRARHLAQGAQEEFVFCGRYLDKLELRGDRWKLIHRQVVMDWSVRHRVTDERNSDAYVALAKGAHLDTDPLFPFLVND